MSERHGRNKVWGVNGKAGQAGIAVWLGGSTLWLLQSLQLCGPGRVGRRRFCLLPGPTASTVTQLHWLVLQPARSIPSPLCPTKTAPLCLQEVKISWKRFHFFQVIFIHYQSSYSFTHYLPEDLTLQLCWGWELWGWEFVLGGWYRTSEVEFWVVPVWYCCRQ